MATTTEILRDAPEIVRAAVRRGWCSEPRKMKPTTTADYMNAKRFQTPRGCEKCGKCFADCTC